MTARRNVGASAGRALELDEIVRADARDLRPMYPAELPETALIRQTRLPILLHEYLIRAQSRRAVRMFRVHLSMVKVRVARKEQPIPPSSNRDPSVTERMREKRDEQNIRGNSFELANAVETEPRLPTFARVNDPVRTSRPLRWPVSHPVHRRRLREGCVSLACEEVYARAWEVVETAGVIEIEVRQENVANVLSVEAERFDLPYGRHFLA